MPGLRLKRWVAVMALGFVLALFGLAPLLRLIWNPGGPSPDPAIDLSALVVGAGLGWFGVRGLIRSVVAVVAPNAPDELAAAVVTGHALRRGPKIVVLGGGTGMPILLRGLKSYTAHLTAIVTSADDGGSTGRLRAGFNIQPPGDVRNCLVALSEAEPLLEQLFQYRFEEGGDLSGHAFGNLFLTAMERTTGDFQTAITASSRVLAVQGRVLMATAEPVVLWAQTSDGEWIRGESKISGHGCTIQDVRLEPAEPKVDPAVAEAILAAEAVVIAPGSLWTSILPVLLAPGVAEAIRTTRAAVIYVQNLMTQPGETTGMGLGDHLRAIERHLPGAVGWVVVHDGAIDPALLARYATVGAEPVAADTQGLIEAGKRVRRRDLLAPGPLIRHDSGKLARAVLEIVLDASAAWEPRRRMDFLALAERLRRSEESPWQIPSPGA